MEAQPVKACPFCGETVLAVAIKCKHCKSMIGLKPGAALSAGALANSTSAADANSLASDAESPVPLTPGSGRGEATAAEPLTSDLAADALPSDLRKEAYDLRRPSASQWRSIGSTGIGVVIATVIGVAVFLCLYAYNSTERALATDVAQPQTINESAVQASGKNNAFESLVLAAAIPSNDSRTGISWNDVEEIRGVKWDGPYYESKIMMNVMTGEASWSGLGEIDTRIYITGPRAGPNIFSMSVAMARLDESALKSWRWQRIYTTCDEDLVGNEARYFRIERQGYKPIYVWIENSEGTKLYSTHFRFGADQDLVMSSRRLEGCRAFDAVQQQRK